MQRDNYNFGFIPMVAEWKVTKNRITTLYELYIGDFLLARYFYDVNARSNQGFYKVEGLIPSVKRDIGHFTTMEEAKQKCFLVAKYFVGKVKAGKKTLIFEN